MDDTKVSGRGRKRKTDDSSLSPEEQEKKKKNREAAKKCREKKEKEAQELKQRNAELESENNNLSKEKIKLLEKIKGFKKVINDHMLKGCKLPPAIEQMLSQTEDINLNEDFREVGVIEIPRMHTPPHTPDSSSSDRSLQSVPFRQTEAAPTALFSGTPLPNDVNRRKSSTSSRSPSRSPGPQNGLSASMENKDLSHFFASKFIPPELAPIPPNASRPIGNVAVRSQFPTVVIDDDEDDDVHEVSPLGRTEGVQNQKLHWVPVSDSSSILNKAFEHPGIPSEDVISNQLFEKDDRYRNMNNVAPESENLQSLGFSHHVPPLPEGYSYTEDLAEVEAPNNNIYNREEVSYAEQVVETQAGSQVQSPEENSTANLDLGAYSSAILSLGSLVSDSLHQQIKKQLSSTEAIKQPQQHGQYTISAAQMNSVSMVPETSHENYVTAPASNKIFAKQVISKDNQLVTYLVNSNGQVLYSAKVLPYPLRTNPIPVTNPTNQVIEQTSANLEQDPQYSNSDLPSLNFEDLQQNGNIFDKPSPKNRSDYINTNVSI